MSKLAVFFGSFLGSFVAGLVLLGGKHTVGSFAELYRDNKGDIDIV